MSDIDFLRINDNAEDGNPAAQCIIGLCYMEGLGVPRNPIIAASWWLKSAEQGVRRVAIQPGDDVSLRSGY